MGDFNSIFFPIDRMEPESESIKDSVITYITGTALFGLLSVLLTFIFITFLNISAENQV